MQQRLDEAVDNYLRISNLLRDDLIALLDVEDETPAWRRNFVRVGAALIEGHTHCLREISLVAMACEPTKISRKESQALQDELGMGAAERLKFTLRAAYVLYDLI